jgi:hypothetical protein
MFLNSLCIPSPSISPDNQEYILPQFPRLYHLPNVVMFKQQLQIWDPLLHSNLTRNKRCTLSVHWLSTGIHHALPPMLLLQ